MSIKSCLHCGGLVESDNPKAKFCSPKCKVYHARGIKPKPNLLKVELEAKVPEAVAKVIPEDLKSKHPAGKPWLSKEFLAMQPLRIEPELSKGSLMARLKRIREYNQWMVDIGRPHDQTTERQLEIMLARGGHDWRLAKGVGWSHPDSEVLKMVVRAGE